MEKLSCGQYAFLELCKEKGVEASQIEKLYEEVGMQRECSFLDFEVWSKKLERMGEGVFLGKAEISCPFIAHLQFAKYAHFVLVKKYSTWVTYLDIDKKQHHLPRFLFQLVFTGRIFRLVEV